MALTPCGRDDSSELPTSTDGVTEEKTEESEVHETPPPSAEVKELVKNFCL